MEDKAKITMEFPDVRIEKKLDDINVKLNKILEILDEFRNNNTKD